MGEKSIRRQITVALVVVFASIAALFGTAEFLFERDRYEESKKSIETSLNLVVVRMAGTLGNQVFFQNEQGMALTLSQMTDYKGMVCAAVYDRTGKLLYAPAGYSPDPALSPGELGLQGYAIHEGSYRSEPVLTYAAPLVVVGDHYGYVKVWYGLGSLLAHLRVTLLIFSALLAALFAGSLLIIGRLLGSLVTDPLGRITDSMHRVANGELGVQVEMDSRNEMGMIAKVFNRMSADNALMYGKLEEINRSLERQVIVRTEQLDDSRTLLESVLHSSQDSIMVLKSIIAEDSTIVDFEWLMANPQAAAMFAAEEEAILGKRLLLLVPSLGREELFEDFRQVARTGKALNKELYLEFGSNRGWFSVCAVTIREGIAVTIRDVTQRKRLELDLERRANQDGLTGLANRTFFDRRLAEEWRTCAEEGVPLALLFIDVDYFKDYNDAYGHVAGDECLKRLSAVIAGRMSRPRDLAARYGGEEFVALLPRTDADSALAIAQSIRTDLRALALEHRASGVSSFVTISAGAVAVRPSPSLSPKDLVAASDQALYASKSSGRDRCTLAEIG